ncbi:MAG TPA: HEPN domain-containing protein [Sulfolobales archaeon]|nr:HEPN domain-containing protein [Sulfolobales archaeon]
MTKRDEAEYLFERSRRFFETAIIQIDRGFYDLAAFSLGQSIQLYLKACLLKLGADYPRTHSVRSLLELIGDLSGREEVRELLLRYAVELGSLEDAYITSRYIGRDYSREEVERLRETVEEIRNVVGRILGKRS